MIRRATTALAAVFLLLAPASGHAALTAYSQNFETLVQSDPSALSSNGWLVYGNVFNSTHTTFLYGYGPFPAPNGTGFFCGIDAGQGGVNQGLQQLSVYSDYNNADHAAGNQIESNVYREQTIVAGDVGKRWTFQFDAKLGNLAGTTTALAFVKTLNPANNYATTNFKRANMTTTPATWNTYTLSIVITPGLVGQIAQFGFANTTTLYQPAGVFYDNVSWTTQGLGVAVDDVAGARAIELAAAAPSPFTSSTRIVYSLAIRGAAELSVYDVVGRRVATLFSGQAEAGTHTAIWDGATDAGSAAPAGV